ncbi:MAG: hypothetical protein WC091_01515 [Sulfuricellaceae bacterium]
MRNVTVTLDKDVADWSRILAAKHNTSVSRMLGELLAEKMMRDERYAAAMEEFLAPSPTMLNLAPPLRQNILIPPARRYMSDNPRNLC